MKLQKTLAVLIALGAGLPALVRAQPTAPIQQFERTQRELPLRRPGLLNLSTNTEAPELYPGENTDVGPQRILRLKPRKTYFEIIADSQFFHTDNALLSDKTKAGTTLFVNTVQAALAPEAYKLGSGQFSPQLGFRSQWFDYGLSGHDGGLSHLDFNAQTAFINGRQEWGLWQLFGGLDFTRLLDQHHYAEGYREYVPALGLQRFFPFGDRLVFAAGSQIGYHFTGVPPPAVAPFYPVSLHVNDRFDCVVNLSLAYALLPQLVVQPFYRFQYCRYPQFSDGFHPVHAREDLIHSVGASLAYYFKRSVAVRFFTSYEIQDSSYPGSFDYHKFDAGGGATLDVRF